MAKTVDRPAGTRAAHRPVGIKDVAKHAGVSLGTVSHVLNHPDRVSLEMRERVAGVIKELGFVRNGSASRLRAARSKTIGLVLLDTGNPFFAEVARGVEEVTEEHGYITTLCNTNGLPEREERQLQYLEEQRVAGVLISPTGARRIGAQLTTIAKRGIAVVLVDEPVSRANQCSIAVDDVRGGEMVGDHLVSLGRRRITYVTGPSDLRQMEDRRRGLVAAIERSEHAADISVDVLRLDKVTSREGYDCVSELLAMRPDAVFCGNDIVALGVLRGLIEREVDVPEQIALAGYDDIEFAGLSAIPLTSVRQPAYGIGRAAAQLMIDECTASQHEHRQIIFQPELVTRQSTVGRPAGLDRPAGPVLAGPNRTEV